MKFWIRNWYKVGFIFGIILLLFMMMTNLPTLTKVMILNLVFLFVHQFEEYQFPGGAPIIINKVVYDEKKNPDRYPGNTLSIMIVNVSAWIIYLLSIIFSNLTWLLLGVIFFSLFQILGHCIQMPIKLKIWYNPGMITSIFLFLPLGVYFIHYLTINNQLSVMNVILGLITMIGCIMITIILPVQSLKNRHTAFVIEDKQINKFNKIMQKCHF